MPDPTLTRPPTPDDFRRWTEPAGARSARIGISGIAVEFEGIPDGLADRMEATYAPYLTVPTGAGRPPRIRILRAPVEYFLPLGIASRGEVYRMLTDPEEGVFRSVSYRLASWLDLSGRVGEIAMDTGELDPAPPSPGWRSTPAGSCCTVPASSGTVAATCSTGRRGPAN